MLVLLKLDPSVDGIPIIYIYIYIPHLFGRIWWFNLHWLGGFFCPIPGVVDFCMQDFKRKNRGKDGRNDGGATATMMTGKWPIYRWFTWVYQT